MASSFSAKIASRGFHVYKNTTWNDVKEGDKVLIDIEKKNQRKLIRTAVRLKLLEILRLYVIPHEKFPDIFTSI